eukprot:Skav213044  [mRNA]  locus=scaffold844:826791:828746:+ [translate_table: standard]
MIANDASVASHARIRDLDFDATCEDPTVVLHFAPPTPVLRLQGGGGNGNKADHRQTVLAGIASLCIGTGVRLDDVPQVVTKLQKAVPFQQLSNLVALEPLEKQQDQIKRLFRDCDVQTSASVHTDNVKKKIQRTTQQRYSQQDRSLDPQQYKLISSFWKMSNGEPAPVHSTYTPHQPGITMLTKEQAQKWISQDLLSADESAILVIDDLQLPEGDRYMKVVAPALNAAGADVLLAGWLIQMGAKHINPVAPDGEKLETWDIQVCSVTLWKDEFSPEQWSEAISSPVRFAKKILERDSLHEALTQPWGRTYRSGTSPCTPSQASSVQFHCQVRLKDLRKLLRRSGWTGVHITPKDALGKPSDKWRPIWMSQPKDILEARTASLGAVAGYIRGQKSGGIRVETSSFAECWAKLKPDQPVPIQLKPGKVWKLHPFPYGVDRDVLQSWAQHIQWDAQPVKSLGARSWLFNASQPPPTGVLRFNEHPLISTLVPSRSTTDAIGLIAGPRSKPLVTSTDSKERNAFRTGDPFADPWAASAASRAAPSASTGPTTDQLDNHSRRLNQLEETMQKFQQDQQAAHKQTTDRIQNVEMQVQSFHDTTQQAFQTLRADFQSTLKSALQNQDSKVQSTFDEIKQLLLRKDKRKTQEPEEDDDM